MFTGIVETVGTVTSIEVAGDLTRLTAEAASIVEGVAVGASIAVNGGCLTVVAIDDACVSFEAVRETMERIRLARQIGEDTADCLGYLAEVSFLR